MSLKTLLVHVEVSPESDRRLRMAVTLSQELSATLAGVGGCEPAYIDDPMLSSTDGMVAQVFADQEVADLREAEARFRSLTAPLGAAAFWMSFNDYPDRALEICAAGADLIVTSARRGARAKTAGAADLIMRAGLPILAIPEDLPAIRTRTIVVAWKNTAQARRAISDALPLLRAAEKVIVVDACSVTERRAAWSGLDATLGRLSRDGVHATAVETLRRPNMDATDVLISFAEDHLADLIVAGGYGHSPALEWALGGMTQGLLERSTLPILFSH